MMAFQNGKCKRIVVHRRNLCFNIKLRSSISCSHADLGAQSVPSYFEEWCGAQYACDDVKTATCKQRS